MNKKTKLALLVALNACVIAFLGAYATFFILKESTCAKDINTPQCGQHFVPFVERGFQL